MVFLMRVVKKRYFVGSRVRNPQKKKIYWDKCTLSQRNSFLDNFVFERMYFLSTYRKKLTRNFSESGVGSGWRRGGMVEDVYVWCGRPPVPDVNFVTEIEYKLYK